MTMERNLNERKKGIRDVCKEDGRGFGTIVILSLCHSASLSLYYKSFTLSLSLLASTFLTKKIALLLLILSLSPSSPCVSFRIVKVSLTLNLLSEITSVSHHARRKSPKKDSNSQSFFKYLLSAQLVSYML